MSADNGIYIAHFPDGWRVCHAQAIDNVDYYPVGSKERKEMLETYFGKSQLFPTEAEALFAAWKLSKEIGYTEYGICDIGEYEQFRTRESGKS